MVAFRAQGPGAAVLGAALHHLIDVFAARPQFRALLKKHGFDAVDAATYYPHQRYLDMLREAHDISPTALEMVMERVFWREPAPMGLHDAESVFECLDMLHQAGHRGKAGGWKYEKVSDGEYVLTNSSPYPCGFAYGVIRGLARKFGRPVTIEHGADCRMRGADACTYEVSLR